MHLRILSTADVSSQPVIVDSAPPDGGYGWVIVGACAVINGFTWGIISSYGVYLSYYISHETFRGATDLDFTFVGGSNFAAAMLVAPVLNILIPKFGIRPLMFFGVLTFSAGFICASFAQEFWQLVLTQGVLVGIGCGFTQLPSTAIIPQWFSKRRSLANGITSAGSGIGGVIFSSSTTAMIETVSLAWSLRIIGVVAFVMLFSATSLLRDRNAIIKPKLHPFDTKLLRRYDVFLLLSWGFINMLGYTTLLYSLSAFALSIGASQTEASLVTTILNLGTAIGRPLTGVLSDRYGRFTVAGLLTFICGILCFAIWIPATSLAITIFFALLSGMILGIFWVTIGPLCAEVVALEDLPSLLSLTWLMVVLPTFFSEAVALQLRRPHDARPYLYPQLYSGICYIVASLFLLELRRVKCGIWTKEKHR